MSRLLPSLPDATPEDRDPRVVDVDDDDAEQVIAALGSETARNALSALHEEPATTSELADELDTSLQNVQYHLAKLSEADVVDVVDTTYSEKGREMKVYAPTDEPLVLFAGGSDESTGIRSALQKLLGGYGIIGLGALVTQEAFTSFLSETTAGVADDAPAAPDEEDTAAEEDAAAEEDTAAEEEAEPDEDVEDAPTVDEAEETDDDVEVSGEVDSDGHAFAAEDDAAERADLLVELANVLVEPGAVFFLGAALVFTLAWAYWYRNR